MFEQTGLTVVPRCSYGLCPSQCLLKKITNGVPTSGGASRWCRRWSTRAPGRNWVFCLLVEDAAYSSIAFLLSVSHCVVDKMPRLKPSQCTVVQQGAFCNYRLCGENAMVMFNVLHVAKHYRGLCHCQDKQGIKKWVPSLVSHALLCFPSKGFQKSLNSWPTRLFCHPPFILASRLMMSFGCSHPNTSTSNSAMDTFLDLFFAPETRRLSIMPEILQKWAVDSTACHPIHHGYYTFSIQMMKHFLFPNLQNDPSCSFSSSCCIVLTAVFQRAISLVNHSCHSMCPVHLEISTPVPVLHNAMLCSCHWQAHVHASTLLSWQGGSTCLCNWCFLGGLFLRKRR